jgi:hypothetical protein
MGVALCQPPLQQRNLRSGQIVRQHIEWDGAVSFGEGGTQARFDFLRTPVTNSP